MNRLEAGNAIRNTLVANDFRVSRFSELFYSESSLSVEKVPHRHLFRTTKGRNGETSAHEGLGTTKDAIRKYPGDSTSELRRLFEVVAERKPGAAIEAGFRDKLMRVSGTDAIGNRMDLARVSSSFHIYVHSILNSTIDLIAAKFLKSYNKATYAIKSAIRLNPAMPL